MSLSLKRVSKFVTRLRLASRHGVASSLDRYQSSTVQARDQPAPGGLPVELLLQIISHLDHAELLVLCVTSKHFYAVAYPILYKTIHIKHGTSRISKQQALSDQKLQLLCRSLRIGHISSIVTEFRVELWGCGYRRRRPKPSPCVCDKMDSLVGKALAFLVNLQFFRLRCICCSIGCDEKPTRHAYLGKLPITKLRSLWLGCWCMPCNILAPIFTFPGLQRITVLRWDTLRNRLDNQTMWPVQRLTLTSLSDLPDLSKFMCNSVALSSALISRGRLTHLICNDTDQGLHDLISKNQARLIHLRVPILQGILIGMQRDQAPYRSISHLGCVRFLMSNVSPSVYSLMPITRWNPSLPRCLRP